ncbi:MAG: PilZ domain-containing protein, partial [Hoeflea sp.]|uniref:PilZ domain-containing protein n=1 Tax=Hoeflea sp. TaxID=1940281 RepID=UPI0027302118|nr:PilZ domain-containing protein [Hoeflea sp.]MDP2120112.1 PilZ domain-containing protein [Hoeflea sp.]MDP3526066.1 PilZ domain-containing protein [Hoeflea sp.]MDZ7600219.1 PilZ domain-containing protein [Hoeflea sp.]
MLTVNSTSHYHAPPEAPERQYSRVTISVQGRFMRADHSEHDCIVDTMSPFDAVISSGNRPEVGERIVAYLDYIGRVEGKVTEASTRSFTISINATDRKRDKLSAQLTWLANKHELGLPEDRRHERVAPSNPMSEIRLDDGRRYPCRIIDLSVSGAAVEIDVRPAFGTMVLLGNMRGRVVRHFQEGIAMEFMTIQPEDAINKLS